MWMLERESMAEPVRSRLARERVFSPEGSGRGRQPEAINLVLGQTKFSP